MKTSTLYLFLILLILLLSCYEIESINQPYTAELNSTFDVPITVTIGAEEPNIVPDFGILLPSGWSVNEPIEIKGAIETTLRYSANLSNVMQTIDPAPPDYTWWMAHGEQISTQAGTCSFVVHIKTNNKIGSFFIDYVIGFGDAIDGCRSNNHPILVGITKEEADLYVHPDGNDLNSGLSFADPLKRVTTAVCKIVADSIHPHTIHLSNGTYCSTNGEYLPLQIPSFVSLKGESKDGVVWDAESQKGLIKFDHTKNSTIENMTFCNANSRAILYNSSNPNLKNIKICKNKAGGIDCKDSDLFLSNVLFHENEAKHGAAILCSNSTLTCNNTTFTNNNASRNGGAFYFQDTVRFIADHVLLSGNSASYGGSISCSDSKVFLENIVIKNSTAHLGGGIYGTSSNITLQNVKIENNKATPRGGGIYCSGTNTFKLENCVIRWNSTENSGGGIFCHFPGTVIFDSLARCDIYHNKGGVVGKDLYWNNSSNAHVHVYLDTFTTLTPLESHAYPLSTFTFDILATNPTGIKDESSLPATFALKQNYPNPFNPTTTIEYDVPKSCHVHLIIYDVLGRHVCSLIDQQENAGRHQKIWNGTNERGIPVSGGLYFCRLQAGDYRSVVKMVLVR